MKSEVLVSVCMTAYNQAKFIVEAIEGVLMQQTDFPFELLIGEDFSMKDNTLDICLNYQKNILKLYGSFMIRKIMEWLPMNND